MNLGDPSTLATAGVVAGAAALGAFWQQARGLAQHVSGVVLLQKTVEGGMSQPLALHIREKYRKLPSGLSTYRGMLAQLDGQAVNSYVPFDMPNGTSIWYGRRGLFVVSVSGGIKLISLRWLSNPQGLVTDALEACNQRAMSSTYSNFYVRRIMGTAGERPNFERQGDSPARVSGNSLSAPEVSDDSMRMPDYSVDRSFMYAPERYMPNQRKADPMRGLFFPPEVHALITSLKHWHDRQDWYQQHGIPWRTGALLHGPGGTGKSSLARVVAETLGLPLYQFYLNTLTDREFVREWDELMTPCVVALEDFDTVFHGREPVTVHKSLSFECVLNQISGISAINGILLIVTTNRLEHIDPALGQLDNKGRPTRPGRIDHILHMGATTPDQRTEIARFVLGGWADDLIPGLLAEGSGAMAAQFQSMCVQAALHRLGETTKTERIAA